MLHVLYLLRHSLSCLFRISLPMLYSNTFLNIYFIDLESLWNYHKPGQADEFKTRTMFILFNYFSKQVSKAAGGQRKMKMSHLRGIIIIITCTSEFQWFFETLKLKLFKVRKIILLNFRTTFKSNYGFKMLILLDYKNIAPQGWILYTNKPDLSVIFTPITCQTNWTTWFGERDFSRAWVGSHFLPQSSHVLKNFIWQVSVESEIS